MPSLPRCSLEQAALSERQCLPRSDHQVIKRSDVDQRERIAQSARDELVSLARFRHSARVVVREDHRGRVVAQRALHDLARMNARAVDGACEQNVASNQPVPIVEREN